MEAVAEGQRSGDITENTDVAIALGNLSRVRARMHQIKSALANPTSGEVAPPGTVSVGRIIEIRFDDEDPETYLFGSVEDRHTTFTTMTEASPVGREIVGASEGAVIDVSLGGALHRVAVLSIREDA
jgi:transcription elongation GreA/GreB family factor